MDLNWNKEILPRSDQTSIKFEISSARSMLTSMKIPFFSPNVTKLHLYFDGQIASNSTNLLSKIINLSQLTEIQLECFLS